MFVPTWYKLLSNRKGNRIDYLFQNTNQTVVTYCRGFNLKLLDSQKNIKLEFSLKSLYMANFMTTYSTINVKQRGKSKLNMHDVQSRVKI